jgi:beta-galactosidase
VEVEVYSDADEVELEVNGRSLGRRAAGAEHGFRATFTVPYEPGVLAAFGLARDGSRSRTELHTAEAGVLSVVADRSELRADDGDLAFLSIELRDGHGVLDSARETTVTVRIEGPGTLQALASARPSTEESFTDPSWRTFDGRALAIVRPIGPGEITAIVTSEAQEESIVRMIAT